MRDYNEELSRQQRYTLHALLLINKYGDTFEAVKNLKHEKFENDEERRVVSAHLKLMAESFARLDKAIEKMGTREEKEERTKLITSVLEFLTELLKKVPDFS